MRCRGSSNFRFNANVVLKSITLIGGDGQAHPRKMSVFKNRTDIDFANVERLTPTQSWDLSPDPRGDLQYPTRYGELFITLVDSTIPF